MIKPVKTEKQKYAKDYYQNGNGKEVQRRYRQSEYGRQKVNERARRYTKTEAVREKTRMWQKNYRDKHPEFRLHSAAKERAVKLGLEFNIEYSDIIIPEICPLLGVPLIRRTKYAPSLDRIDNNKGYIKGNVWVISRKANAMKNDASLSELTHFAKAILDIA